MNELQFAGNGLCFAIGFEGGRKHIPGVGFDFEVRRETFVFTALQCLQELRLCGGNISCMFKKHRYMAMHPPFPIGLSGFISGHGLG